MFYLLSLGEICLCVEFQKLLLSLVCLFGCPSVFYFIFVSYYITLHYLGSRYVRTHQKSRELHFCLPAVLSWLVAAMSVAMMQFSATVCASMAMSLNTGREAEV